MSYSGDLRHYNLTKDLFLKQGRIFVSERSGSSAKIIIEGRELKFFDKSNNFTIPVLCKMVNKDVKNYFEKNKSLKKFQIQPSVFFNLSEIERCLKTDIYAYDINACYWNIAKREGFISEKTYNYGLENKEARLIAIGNLNKKTLKGEILNGEIIEKTIDNPFENVWFFILNETFKMYNEVRNLVGENFISWNTDCVYVSNQCDLLLENYFKSKELTIKKEKIKLLEIKGNEVQYYNYKKEKVSSWFVGHK